MRPELLLDACGRPKRFFTPFSIEKKLSEADGKKEKTQEKIILKNIILIQLAKKIKCIDNIIHFFVTKFILVKAVPVWK